MKRFSLIAVALSLAVNAGALVVIAAGIEESSLPRGQVIVSEFVDQADATLIAQIPSQQSVAL